MERAELLRLLGRFGLNEREASLYLHLLRAGSLPAGQIARELGTDRVVTYRTLDSLRARGVLRTTAERPRRYAAIPPRSLLDQNLHERQDRLTQDTSISNELVEEMSRQGGAPEHGAPSFQLLTSHKSIYPHLREILRRAQSTVDVMITTQGLQSSIDHGVAEEVTRFLRADGRFRLLVESDPRVRPLLRRFVATRHRHPRVEVRQLYPQPARVTIVDRREVLIFPVPGTDREGGDEIAVWTNNPEFLRSQTLYFDAFWERAGPPSLLSPVLDKPRTASSRTRAKR
jgi:sugar-specific transcriptional regulator TrmB